MVRRGPAGAPSTRPLESARIERGSARVQAGCAGCVDGELAGEGGTGQVTQVNSPWESRGSHEVGELLPGLPAAPTSLGAIASPNRTGHFQASRAAAAPAGSWWGAEQPTKGSLIAVPRPCHHQHQPGHPGRQTGDSGINTKR